jgi:ABC-type phosphate transport system substrate-binding protein
VTVGGEPEQHLLGVSKDGTGTGVVSSEPTGIDCGGDCDEEYDHGTVVTLTATPDAGSEFVAWEGCDAEPEGKCEVTMDEAREVKATFDEEPTPEFPLTIELAGSGEGEVTSDPAGIACVPDCEAAYLEGEVVELLATPKAGSEFAGWTAIEGDPGTCAGVTSPCEVTVDEAIELKAAFKVEAPPSEASCEGGNIVGVGSSLQKESQQSVWIPGFQGSGGVCFEKGAEPTVAYEPSGSGSALAAWDFNGPDGTPFDTSKAFTATDDAPTTAQIENAKAAASGDAEVLVIPVAQTAIAVAANPPAGCQVEEITNRQLERVFNGAIRKWGQILTASGPGCAGAKLTRVVRPDGSGTTYQLKNYLGLINKQPLPCTEGSLTWKGLRPIGAEEQPNVSWPESGAGGCSANELSPVVTAGAKGNAALVEKLNETEGGLGYAALPDLEASRAGDTAPVGLQNNGLVRLADATFAAAGVAGKNSNCADAKYKVPADAQIGGGSGENVDWSQVFGAKTNIGGTAFPLCTLTFDMALKGYEAAGFSAATATTVTDYLREYVTAKAGQDDIAEAEEFYAPLPTSPKPKRDVLGAAQLAASKIEY